MASLLCTPPCKDTPPSLQGPAAQTRLPTTHSDRRAGWASRPRLRAACAQSPPPALCPPEKRRPLLTTQTDLKMPDVPTIRLGGAAQRDRKRELYPEIQTQRENHQEGTTQAGGGSTLTQEKGTLHSYLVPPLCALPLRTLCRHSTGGSARGGALQAQGRACTVPPALTPGPMPTRPHCPPGRERCLSVTTRVSA